MIGVKVMKVVFSRPQASPHALTVADGSAYLRNQHSPLIHRNPWGRVHTVQNWGANSAIGESLCGWLGAKNNVWDSSVSGAL
jgi:hypothetical protein